MKLFNTRSTLVALFVATLVLGSIVSSFLLRANTPVVQAQEPPATTLPRTITVVGEGTVSIEPDVAQATIGVEVLRPSVQEASAEVGQILEQVVAALREQGIADEDIQTSGFSVYSERFSGPEGPSSDDQINYRVSNNVSVTIRDLTRVGAILEAAINAGANNIFGINFSLDDPSTVESEARQRAIENAAIKAAELAELNGLSVGPVVSISEVIATDGVYAGNFARESMNGGGGGVGPILPGELELLMRLQVVYTLAE
jgi:uncharacterized protein YggE